MCEVSVDIRTVRDLESLLRAKINKQLSLVESTDEEYVTLDTGDYDHIINMWLDLRDVLVRAQP